MAPTPATWRTDPPQPGGAAASQAQDLPNMAAALPLPAAARLWRPSARPASRAVALPAPPRRALSVRGEPAGGRGLRCAGRDGAGGPPAPRGGGGGLLRGAGGAGAVRGAGRVVPLRGEPVQHDLHVRVPRVPGECGGGRR